MEYLYLLEASVHIGEEHGYSDSCFNTMPCVFIFLAWDGNRQGFLLGFGLGPALELVETKTAFEGKNASTGHTRSNSPF